MSSRPRRDFSLTIALCASLVVHAALLARTAELYNQYLNGNVAILANPAVPAVQFQPPLPPEDENDPWKRIGETNGTGEAIASVQSDQTLQAPKANQAQPFLSLDPAGPGEIGDEPSQSLLPKGPPQQTAPPAQESPPVEQMAAAGPFGLPIEQGDYALPIGKQTSVKEPSQPSAAEAQAAPQVMQPGADSSADPAPEGRLESDPTTIAGGVDFRPGATNVRLGRPCKLVRPHLTLAARADLLTMASRTVILKIKTDTSGKVTDAQIYRSCGSVSVDQPCKLAALGWWFEPPKNSTGQPVNDVFLFAIHFI